MRTSDSISATKPFWTWDTASWAACSPMISRRMFAMSGRPSCSHTAATSGCDIWRKKERVSKQINSSKENNRMVPDQQSYTGQKQVEATFPECDERTNERMSGVRLTRTNATRGCRRQNNNQHYFLLLFFFFCLSVASHLHEVSLVLNNQPRETPGFLL